MSEKKKETDSSVLLPGQVRDATEILGALLGRVDPDEVLRMLRCTLTADELEELWGVMDAINAKPIGLDHATGKLIGEDLGRDKSK